ncbi:MAG: DUF3261 domain-containing protein [Myxococcota bacterium]
MRVGALALLTLLTGCVTTPRPPPPAEFALRLSPASLGRELQLVQRITVLRGDERRSFDAQLEADATVVRIAAVALGQTVASLSWDGTTLAQQVSTHVPPAVTAARILSDVQLAWWPAEAIRAALPGGFSLLDEAGERVLLRDGAPWARVRYEGTAPAWRHVRLEHAHFGYALDIESVEASP